MTARGVRACWYLAGGLTVEESFDISATREGSHELGAQRARERFLTRLVVGPLLLVMLATMLAGCGSGTRQDEDAATGEWTVKVLRWNFPKRQPLGRPQNFGLLVRNTDTRDIPQLVVTIAGLKEFVRQPGAATNTRPVWIPNDVRYDDVTPNNSALAMSFNLGPLAAGKIRRYSLKLTPLRRGKHRVGYTLSGNLTGGAKLVTEDGAPAASSRVVAIDPTPDFDESIFKD